jgi:hypothetical protein
MAASVTCTEERLGNVKKITWAWTSHTDGKVATATAGAATTYTYTGELIRLVTVPDGTAAPTDNYDIMVYDGDSVDALMAGGQNRATATTQQVAAANLGIVANDKLTLYVENAGDTKKGTIYLYIR